MKIMFFSLIVLSLLISCATTYQKMGPCGGYSDTQLSENVFQVYFQGNGYTSEERASDLCLLRCAELTSQNGFSHFIIMDSSVKSKYSIYTEPSTSHTSGNIYSYGNNAYHNETTYTYGGGSYLVAKPRITIKIICFNVKPEDNGLCYDAEFIIKSISGKYGIQNSVSADQP